MSAREKRMRHLHRIFNTSSAVDDSPPVSYLLRNCRIPCSEIPLCDSNAARAQRKKALFLHRSSESVCAEPKSGTMLSSNIRATSAGRKPRKAASRFSSASCLRDSGVSSSCSGLQDAYWTHKPVETPSMRLADRIDNFLRQVNAVSVVPKAREKLSRYPPVPADPILRYPMAFTAPAKPFTPRLNRKSSEVQAWLRKSDMYNPPTRKVKLEPKRVEPDDEYRQTFLDQILMRWKKFLTRPTGKNVDLKQEPLPVRTLPWKWKSLVDQEKEVQVLTELDKSLKAFIECPQMTPEDVAKLEQIESILNVGRCSGNNMEHAKSFSQAPAVSVEQESEFRPRPIYKSLDVINAILEDLKVGSSVSRATQKVLFDEGI
ncbi:unnamed protein product [Notodromas monacha]|uniref:Uncharacterized protein n=1 Tax=Notodromas monacha TaxID=399045 RepID=A0A7R9BNH2_9CRUS|nr:unnamed protein product [Notodromas monacha]CAG0918764.1 unnamed protein product [Notodromas monacha]